MTSNKLKTLMIILIVMNLILIIIYAASVKKEKVNSELQTYKLGTATVPGYIGVEMQYDTDIVDIELITPSGKHINKLNVDVCEINEENKTITFLKDTDEMGDWFVSFNTKHNTNINYKFISKYSPTLRMTDIELIKSNNYYYLSFTPMMETTDDITTVKSSVTMQSQKHSFFLDTNEIKLNEPAYILFNPKYNAYNGEMYTIRVSLQIDDESSNIMQSTNKSIQLRLEDKTSSSESELSETDTEENAKPEKEM